MKRITPITPGEFLLEEFLEPLKITPYRLAKDTHMPATRIDAIIKGKRRITVDTAFRLSRYFGNSVEFWMNLQAFYEIKQAEDKIRQEIEKIQPLKHLKAA
jgi:addiction module HigA family antidote